MITKSSSLNRKILGRKSSCFSFQSIVRDSLHRSITGSKRITTNLQLSKLPNLSRDVLKDLVDSFPHVKHLDLSGCYQICKESIEVIANGFKDSLHSLNLEFCHYITDEDITLFFGDHEKAESENFSNPSLTSLNLSYTNISDRGVRSIAFNCPNLEVLKLRGMKNITNLSLSMIAKNCKKLVSLDIQDCNISDYGMQLISQECPSLESLNLSQCTEITNQVVPYFCYHNKSLKFLNIRQTKIDGGGISSLLKSLPLIENLNICGLSASNEDLTFVPRLKYLKSLDISFCYNVSKDLILEIVSSCQLLVELNLFGLSINLEEKQVFISANSKLALNC
jgi:hypothetical protein